MATVKKQLKDLNLLDRFLFAEAMDDPVIMKHMLEIILGKDILLKELPQTEKETRTSPYNRFIRLDVWAWDVEDSIYDTEVQKIDTKNLPKRSRYYQGVIDSRLLAPGVVDFNQLNKVFVILITPFDLFGRGFYRYTFRNRCDEAPDISLEDDAVRIFLNTHGTNQNGISNELIELLTYMEHTTAEVSSESRSLKIHEMQSRIEAIKSNEEVGVKFMQAWEEKIIDKMEARSQGIAEGELSKLVSQLCKKLSRGQSVEQIAEALEESPEYIAQLCVVAEEFAPDYNIESILAVLTK